LEERIARELWRWAFADGLERAKIVGHGSDFLTMLEFYLGGLLCQSPAARKRGWWCDGVLAVEITRRRRHSFRLAGRAYLTATEVGPFEMELYFARRRATAPTRVVLRCGPSGGGERLRPPRDDEWTIAVEFTPEDG